MQRTIFQIMSAPISKDEHICESDFFDHWFTKSIANYVSKDVNRDELIARFKIWLEMFGSCKFDEKNASFILYKGFHESYFKQKYVDFMKQLRELKKVSLQEFCHDGILVSGLLSNLQSTVTEIYDDYVSPDEFDPIPMDEFFRTAEINKPYFIGGVLGSNC